MPNSRKWGYPNLTTPFLKSFVHAAALYPLSFVCVLSFYFKSVIYGKHVVAILFKFISCAQLGTLRGIAALYCSLYTNFCVASHASHRPRYSLLLHTGLSQVPMVCVFGTMMSTAKADKQNEMLFATNSCGPKEPSRPTTRVWTLAPPGEYD